MRLCAVFFLAVLAQQVLLSQTGAALFDAEAANSFFKNSPNLAEESRKYYSEAEAEYLNGKIAAAYSKLTAAKYLSNLAKAGKSAPAELRAELLSDPALLDEFVSSISPEDNMPKVFEILSEIREKFPEKFEKYPRLAIAISIVFDAPPPKNWPHGQVSEKLLPRVLPNPAKRFEDIVSMRERGKFLIQTEKLSVEELKYLVASPASDEDIEWAQKSVSVNLSNIQKLYPSINYDKARLNQKLFNWNGDDYRLKTIKSRGGICTDQAYFTSEVAKANGVPALIFSGAGSDGFHAWVGYMQRLGSWNFDVGRYENARFVTGTAIDPQTWKTATDHALGAMREGFRNGAKYKNSEMHTAFANYFYEREDFEKSLESAKSAVVSDQRNAVAWNTLVASMEKLGKPKGEICSIYESAVRAFSKYPDIDAEFRKKLVEMYREDKNYQAARKLSTSIMLKTKNARPDIAMEFARKELELDIAEGSADKLISTYKRLLSAFKSDSAVAIGGITVPIVNALLKAEKYEETREIMETTRKVLKPSKNALIKPVLDNIDSQLDSILKKYGKKTE